METSQFLRANALAKDDDLKIGGLFHLADEVPKNRELRLHDRLGAAAQPQVNRGLHPLRETQDQKEASEHLLQPAEGERGQKRERQRGTWEEGGQNESAEFLGGVVRNGTLSQESLFNFEEKFEKLYNRVPPRDTVLDLSKCKMETTQKRMASIKNTLSGYYRRFGVPVSPFALVQLSLI